MNGLVFTPRLILDVFITNIEIFMMKLFLNVREFLSAGCGRG